MRDYELLYIVTGDKSEDDATKVTDDVNAALLKTSGKVDNENVWGRRKLAYPVAKQEHGWYTVTQFSLEPTKLADFQKALSLNKDVLRAVTVRASELPSPDDAAKLESVQQETEAKKPTKQLDVPETVATKKRTIKKVAPTAARKKPAPAKKESAADQQKRQAKLDKKLSEILKEE